MHDIDILISYNSADSNAHLFAVQDRVNANDQLKNIKSRRPLCRPQSIVLSLFTRTNRSTPSVERR